MNQRQIAQCVWVVQSNTNEKRQLWLPLFLLILLIVLTMYKQINERMSCNQLCFKKLIDIAHSQYKD